MPAPLDPTLLADYLQRAYRQDPATAAQQAAEVIKDPASKAYQGLQAEMQQAYGTATPQEQDKELSQYQQYYQMLQRNKQTQAKAGVIMGKINAKGECTCQH